MRIFHRASVAVAMTVAALFFTALLVVWMRGDNVPCWYTFNYVMCIVTLAIATVGAWQALSLGTKPAQFAPLVGAFMLATYVVAVLVTVSGAKLSEASTSQIPEPAASIFCYGALLCFTYVASMGFWLVKYDCSEEKA